MGLSSQHHEYATTRLHHLKSWPETGAAKLEAEILRHVLMQLAIGNTTSIARPIIEPTTPPTPKPVPITSVTTASTTTAIVTPEVSRMLIITDRATDLTRIMSSKFDLPTVLERFKVGQDWTNTYEFDMASSSAAQNLVSSLHRAFAPQKVTHPTVSGNWYPKAVAQIVADIVTYGLGEMGVRAMPKNIRDHGLRVTNPDLSRLVHYHQRYDTIVRDYLLVTGHGCDGSVAVPEEVSLRVDA